MPNINYETNAKHISDVYLAMHLTNEHLGENTDGKINCEFEKMVSKNSANRKKIEEKALGKSEKPNNTNNKLGTITTPPPKPKSPALNPATAPTSM